MSLPLDTLTITAEEGATALPTTLISSLFEKIINGEKVSQQKSVDLIFCTSDTIQSLNRDYRNKDAITDVLSFPFEDDDYLGEIYICSERALEQAQKYELTPTQECTRLFVHGLFHLLGYDHIQESERLIMESKEFSYFTVEEPLIQASTKPINNH